MITRVALVISLLFNPLLLQKSQEKPDVCINVVAQEKIKPFRTHVGMIDRRVRFRLTNTTGREIVVYGSKYETGLNPISYLLKYDEQSGGWLYPTSNNKPLEWKRRSSIYKDPQALAPGESINFDSLFSSETDGRKRFRVTAYISWEGLTEPLEIRSEEFIITQ